MGRLHAVLLALLTLGPPLGAQAPGAGLVIVLIGPPGSGKSTQAAFLNKKYSIPVITADDLPRGQGLPDAKINLQIRQRIMAADPSKGLVLDGFPSTRSQADFLAALVKELKLPSPIILRFDVPDEVVRQRMLKRGGPGDTPAEIDRQLAEYHKEMDFVTSYYPRADIWTILGTRSPREVSDTIVSLLQDRR